MRSSAETDQRGSVKKKMLTRLGSFSSKKVFSAWASDSLLKPKTLETLIDVHQVDSLPAVLALRDEDITNLGLPIGQTRLLQEAVMKLHAEYTYREPCSPAVRVDVEEPSYKSMLDNDKTPPLQRDIVDNGNYFRFHDIDESIATRESRASFHDSQDGERCVDKECSHERSYNEEDRLESQSGCACQRWLFVSIFMPIILVISLIGAVGWLLLWPASKLCPVGGMFSMLFNSTENIMKLPITSVNWAVGRRSYSEDRYGEGIPGNTRNYGGTDNLSMHDIEKTSK